MVRVESVVILERAAWKEALEKRLARWKCFILIGIMYGLMCMHIHVCMPAVYTVEFVQRLNERKAQEACVGGQE